MKKIFLRATSAVLALCLIISLSACSGKNTANQLEADSTLNNMEEITLTCAENSATTTVLGVDIRVRYGGFVK